MREYKSEIYETLHEDFKTHLEFGKITQAEMDEFEKDCFKDTADIPASRSTHQPTMVVAGPGSHGNNVK
jgi:DNA-binding transcriptional regulator YiaG